MNLLEKKFEEKINLNDYIKDKKESKKTTLEISNNNSDYIKNIENSSKNYDKIYSEFLVFPNNNKYLDYKIHKLNDDDSMDNINIKNISGIKDSNRKPNINNYKRNYNNSIIKLNKTNKNSFNNLNLNYDNINDVGERLYNYSFLTKVKIDKIRKMRDDNFKKLSHPKISKKAKNIKKDEKRLYNENIIKKMRKLSQKNILEKDNSCTFKPELNIKSLKMAQNLEPSATRLNKKRQKKINKEDLIELTKKSYLNLFRNKNSKKYLSINNNNKNINRSQENINRRINDFYEKQINAIKKKEKIYNENKKKKEDEYQKYTFHPKINHKKKSKNKSEINKIVNPFERLYISTKTCKKKDIYKKEKELLNDLCTFKPKISPLKIKDDKKTIQTYITHNNSYIEKRRKNLEKQKNFEEYKNKKLGNKYGYLKPMITNIESGLRTERRCNSRGEKRQNTEENKKYIISKGTIDFNNNYNNNEKIYYYLNNENNDSNINIIKYNNINHNLNQQEFLNAINALHQQIDDLNI